MMCSHLGAALLSLTLRYHGGCRASAVVLLLRALPWRVCHTAAPVLGKQRNSHVKLVLHQSRGTLAASVTVEQLWVGLGFYRWHFQFTWERSGVSMLQPRKDCATRRGSKASVFPNTSREEVGVFAGRSRFASLFHSRHWVGVLP